MIKGFKIYNSILVTATFLVPLVAMADTLQSIFSEQGRLYVTFRTVVGILFVIGTVVFLWGVIQFIAKSGDEAGRAKAKGIMTWGIIGLAVMSAAWGVAFLLRDYFTVQNRAIPQLPGDIRP